MIRPLLEALDTGPIIEIGAATGETTAKLAELAIERDLTLHSVDPYPLFDVSEYERRFGGHFQFHRQKSHEALKWIGPVAAVIVDGDHNWYTVHGELTRLMMNTSRRGHHFPLVMLHDVEWPYARRDMYFEPETIPSPWRKPWAIGGVAWGELDLNQSGEGANPNFAHATTEGDPHNGVLTAVEDFMADCDPRLALRIIRGGFGIGVLASEVLLDSHSELRRAWERLYSLDFLLDEAKRLSESNTAAQYAYLMANRKLKNRENQDTQQASTVDSA